MRINYLKATLKKTALVLTVLLLGAGMKVAHAQVNLTAGPTAAILPDGSSVPMWGYSCGAVVTGATATCAKLNPTATGWSPVVITVPTGQTLTINLTNSLIFGTYSVPTSIMIDVGTEYVPKMRLLVRLIVRVCPVGTVITTGDQPVAVGFNLAHVAVAP